MKMNEAVGQFLKRYRLEHGLTMDDVATASRRYGSGWIAANVRNIEHGGGKADSLPVLILLVQSLHDLTGDDLSITSPFERIGDDLEITDIVRLSPQELDELIGTGSIMLMPNVIDRDERDYWHRDGYMKALRAAKNPVPQVYPDIFPPLKNSKVKSIFDIVPTAAETRAAKKKGISPLSFASWCRYLYDCSMDEEAAKRAGENATPQKRGRFSRLIIQEISKQIDDAEMRLADRYIQDEDARTILDMDF